MSVNQIEFSAAPEPGTVLTLDGQKYDLIGSAPHVRKDGLASAVLTWRTACPACGKVFHTTSGLVTKALNRRCEDHHATCRPVSGRHTKVTATILNGKQ